MKESNGGLGPNDKKQKEEIGQIYIYISLFDPVKIYRNFGF